MADDFGDLKIEAEVARAPRNSKAEVVPCACLASCEVGNKKGEEKALSSQREEEEGIGHCEEDSMVDSGA